MKWLYMCLRLFFCPHKWKLIKNIQVFESENKSRLPIFNKYVCSCNRCGAIKTFKS